MTEQFERFRTELAQVAREYCTAVRNGHLTERFSEIVIPYEQEMLRQRALERLAIEVRRAGSVHATDVRDDLARVIEQAGFASNQNYGQMHADCRRYEQVFREAISQAGMLALDRWRDGSRVQQYWLVEDIRRRNGRVALRALETLAARPMQAGDLDARIQSVAQIRSRFLYSNCDVEGPPVTVVQSGERHWYK